MEKNLNQWIENLPDYYECRETVNKLAALDKAIIRKKREIKRAEDLITIEHDQPRSNATRIAKIQATSILEDELAELEAERVEYNWYYDFYKLTKDVSYIVNSIRFIQRTGSNNG